MYRSSFDGNEEQIGNDHDDDDIEDDTIATRRNGSDDLGVAEAWGGRRPISQTSDLPAAHLSHPLGQHRSR